MSSSENKYKYLNNRFCDRVFTANENKTIGLCLDKNKDKILWSIWAAKEAAFKTCQKKIPEIIFAHKKFSLCKKTLENLIDANFNENLIGTLIYNSLKIAIKWQWAQTSVHCAAVLCTSEKIFRNWDLIAIDIKVKNISTEESLLTRQYAKQFLISLGYNSNIEIIRPTTTINNSPRIGPPVLSLGGEILPHCEISLSHDGDWVGIATNKITR